MTRRCASASRPSGQWRDDDYDVLENGVVFGRIFFLVRRTTERRARGGIREPASRI